ncbi:MAG: hypothetical protein OJI70_12965 [Zavarzinia sp.]|nr:hypothetical protein [Zavarzinia sp.]
MTRWPLIVALVVSAPLTASCSLDYTDADGRRHIVGLNHIVEEPSSPEGGGFIEVRTLGLAVYSHDMGSGAALGWSAEAVSRPSPEEAKHDDRP